MNVLKSLLGLTLAALPVAAAQSAPQSYFGLNTLGAQVTYDTGKYALRLSGGGRTVLGLVYGIGADAAALFPVVGDLNTPSRLSLGAGLDVDVFFASLIIGDCASPTACGNSAAAAVAYRPHVLVNYERRLSDNVTFFTEGSIGVAIAPELGHIVYPGLRLGLNFR